RSGSRRLSFNGDANSTDQVERARSRPLVGVPAFQDVAVAGYLFRRRAGGMWASLDRVDRFDSAAGGAFLNLAFPGVIDGRPLLVSLRPDPALSCMSQASRQRGVCRHRQLSSTRLVGHRARLLRRAWVTSCPGNAVQLAGSGAVGQPRRILEAAI